MTLHLRSSANLKAGTRYPLPRVRGDPLGAETHRSDQVLLPVADVVGVGPGVRRLGRSADGIDVSAKYSTTPIKNTARITDLIRSARVSDFGTVAA
jgi:hypothetical protein